MVQDNAACWAHVGDSRLYHIRNGRIIAQTKDHSRVQQLIDQGRVREEAFGAHPDRNKIFNCLGSHELPKVKLSGKTLLHAGDTLLLCTDGLWGPLSGKHIAAALLNSPIATANLLGEAERRSVRQCDNLSVIALTWEENFQAVPQVQDPARKMPLEGAPAPAQSPGSAGRGASELSDDEIERAIKELRGAFRRNTNGET